MNNKIQEDFRICISGPLMQKYLGKQLSQAVCSRYVFRLFHAPKFQIFSTKLNSMVKVVKLFADVLWKSCSDEFHREKIYASVSFLIKFSAYRLKKDTSVFQWVLPNISDEELFVKVLTRPSTVSKLIYC